MAGARQAVDGPTLLYAGAPAEQERWGAALAKAADAAGEPLRLVMAADAIEDPAEVDYLLYAPRKDTPSPASFPSLKAILSLWAGVEQLLARPDLPADAPIARMVEPGLRDGMVDYVIGHAYRVLLETDALRDGQTARQWDRPAPGLAAGARMAVLGLGELGSAVASAAAALGFPTLGWSRSPKAIKGVDCRHGTDALPGFLAEADILVLLAPQTPETIGLMSAARLALLPDGAHVINAARGPLLPEDALLAALDAPGGVAAATLDVFDVEPLPSDHPYWTHPAVRVTPHIASATRPETAAPVVIAQALRHWRGEPLRHLVDRARGY